MGVTEAVEIVAFSRPVQKTNILEAVCLILWTTFPVGPNTESAFGLAHKDLNYFSLEKKIEQSWKNSIFFFLKKENLSCSGKLVRTLSRKERFGTVVPE